jgi:hypothetical protein
MSKTTKTDETTTEPTIEDRVRADYAAFLDVISDKYRDDLGPNMYWPGETAALSAIPALKAIGQRMKPKVTVAPRPPRDAPPETTPPARTREQVDRGYR